MKARYAIRLFTAAFLFSGLLAAGSAMADDKKPNRPNRAPQSSQAHAPAGLGEGVHLGAYGEHHLNGVVGDGEEFADVHRFVIGLGYQFADWIRFGSELEVEHSYVSDGHGDLVLEQFQVDFLLSKALNVRVGKILVPASSINLYHEPPVFHGVERPFVNKYIVPTTWSADGVGIFGGIGQRVRYQAYLVNGLDGSGFSDSDGIRGGRMKERPGFTHPAFTGRIDVSLPGGELLRTPKLGVFGYTGGANNGNKGGEPGLEDMRVSMVSADLQTGIGRRVELRGFVGLGMISEAELVSGVAEQIFGYSVTGAVDVLPASAKTGRLEQAELELFARHETFDTQFSMPEGQDPNDAYNRSALTLGIHFLPVPKVAVKADYQIMDNATDNDVDDKFNLGVGWMF